MSEYYLIGALVVLMTVASQILLKKGAEIGKSKNSIIYSYVNAFTILGYVAFFAVTLLSLFALKEVMMKYWILLLPIQYILVSVSSYALLRERISKRQIYGTLVIISGIVIYNI